jgi:hypothetical protein
MSAINRGPDALSSARDEQVRDFRGTDGMGALCWILRQHENKNSQFVCKMMQIALDKGAAIDGPSDCKFTPLVFSLQRSGKHQLTTARWLVERGAACRSTSPGRVSPLEQLTHRMSRLGWRSGFQLKKDRVNSIALAESLIAGGADFSGDCSVLSAPVESLLRELRMIRQVKTAQAFMDVFWRAGCQWDPQWDHYLHDASSHWKNLPGRVRQLNAEAQAAKIHAKTRPASLAYRKSRL